VKVLGISAYYHDAAACLVRDGEIAAAAQEERFTRKKHDESFPRNAIRYCLESGGGDAGEIDAVVFYDKPIDKFVRILTTHFSVAPSGLRAFLKAIPRWGRRNLWVRYEIERTLEDMGVTPPPLYFTEHHEAHAASAFFPSPFESAATVTLDGVGEWPTTTIGFGEGSSLRLLREQNFPHSLGLLYSAFTYYLGFTVNADEYKVMGLAPYGRPRFVERILERLLSLNEDGSFFLNMDCFDYLGGLKMTNRAFEQLFDAPVRRPDSKLTQHHADVARSLQAVTEEVVGRIAREAHRLTGSRNLCLAGGVALNCVANGKLLEASPFDSIWVAPAAHDAGGALGAALLAWYQVLGNERATDGTRDAMAGSYLGPGYSNDDIEAFLRGEGCVYTRLDDTEWAPTVARLIADGGIVGLFRGRLEFGPRALGNRSIVADPRSPEVPARINRQVKFREPFRPFAPAVLEECGEEYFDLRGHSPYMLFAVPVSEAHRTDIEPDDPAADLPERLARPRSDIPAVTHVDYSARVQTVSRATNPGFHELISAFREITGCAVLVNTSLNVRGEPTVCTPLEAYRCFLKTGLDHLVMGSYLLSKSAMQEATR
jgi:carbamoyltransferase